MTTTGQTPHQAAAKRANESRDEAAKALAKLQEARDPGPLDFAGLSALQEQAKIDALHLISYDLNAVQAAVESLDSR